MCDCCTLFEYLNKIQFSVQRRHSVVLIPITDSVNKKPKSRVVSLSCLCLSQIVVVNK